MFELCQITQETPNVPPIWARGMPPASGCEHQPLIIVNSPQDFRK
jgi:hypothetical protein